MKKEVVLTVNNWIKVLDSKARGESAKDGSQQMEIWARKHFGNIEG